MRTFGVATGMQGPPGLDSRGAFPRSLSQYRPDGRHQNGHTVTNRLSRAAGSVYLALQGITSEDGAPGTYRGVGRLYDALLDAADVAHALGAALLPHLSLDDPQMQVVVAARGLALSLADRAEDLGENWTAETLPEMTRQGSALQAMLRALQHLYVEDETNSGDDAPDVVPA